MMDRRTRSPGRLAWSEGLRPPGTGAGLHSSDEPGELSQWLSHDDSTINIVIRYYYYYFFKFYLFKKKTHDDDDDDDYYYYPRVASL